MNKEHHVIMKGDYFLKEFTKDKEPVFSLYDAMIFDKIEVAKSCNKIAKGVIYELNKIPYTE